ncbi:hypothetical protein KTS45_00655 [Halomicroarcula limicola]|uniref:Uncharacterized protein n=1 Tax=Haloarcula limicola TaxID=1429915 RepID=A0A8J7Y6U0_9EURY|nr:hypothetical protein [Halomicroarcula limicola]MBV0922698.1 hypothetical protein [Halomicroarcula limicola]
MTEEKRTTVRADGDSTMGDVDHTHPHTNETFGAAFQRGPAVAADGGERSGERDAEDETEAEETMSDVDHEAPGEGVTRAYERGTEGRDETV